MFFLSISSSLAHISPSIPVSVGISPSIRTLDVGVAQEDVPLRFMVTSEQFPTGEDPFAERDPSVGK